MSKFNDFPTLLNAAEAYYYLGYSVIPLFGDLDSSRPKVAARAWAIYQQRLATINEFADWFSLEGGAAGLGIVTGRISRLVVLDFDSNDLFVDFRLRFPDLTETHTVQSAGRGLPHLYFHLPTHLHVASQKRAGVDLLSDGRYVVAPPTQINGQAYRITHGGMPRTLTERDIQRIQSFMSRVPSQAVVSLYKEEPLTHAASSVGTGLRPFRPTSHPTATASILEQPEQSPKRPSREALHGLYIYWCKQGGRNDALFRTAIYARDHGMNETQTRHILASIYISTPSPACGLSAKVADEGLGRGLETQADRQREAYATIHSAFSRPPRPTYTPRPEGERTGVRDGLPNSIREALLGHKQTYVARTLEGLLKIGFREGKGFTTEQAIQLLKGIVGRDSVYNALNALAPNGQPYFRQRSPSSLPPASKEAAKQKQPLKTKKCFFVTEKKSGIKKRGPKQRRFKFPSVRELCKLLGVKVTGSDPLMREDLTSARQTRMAMYRELLKRRPAEYTRRWIANRVGVSRRTIDTYNRLMPVRTQATYHETTLSWTNINNLLSDEVLAGAHIETISGKKYPALHSIACNLLGKGTFIRLKQRKGNFYWYGTDEPPPNILPAVGIHHTVSAPISSPTPLSTEWRGVGGEDALSLSIGEGLRPSRSAPPVSAPVSPTPSPACGGGSGWGFPSTVSRPSPRPEGEGLGVRVSPPLPPDQAETLAQTVYERVNQSADGTGKHFSLKNARKLVGTYTERDIQFALQRLSQRGNLANPTGFFVTVLRSTARMNELQR